jgi:hypothetical protein
LQRLTAHSRPGASSRCRCRWPTSR